MGYKQRRRIVRFGSVSRGIVLPKGWIEFNDFQDGDCVTVLGDSVLIVSHPKDELRAHKVLELIERGLLEREDIGIGQQLFVPDRQLEARVPKRRRR